MTWVYPEWNLQKQDKAGKTGGILQRYINICVYIYALFCLICIFLPFIFSAVSKDSAIFAEISLIQGNEKKKAQLSKKSLVMTIMIFISPINIQFDDIMQYRAKLPFKETI